MIKEEKILSLLNWTKQKISIEACTRAPFFSERELWWVALGDNVGQEINGKSYRFTRPGLVLKKYSSKKCFILPTTTKLHSDRMDYVFVNCKDVHMAVILSQGRTISAKRLVSKIGTLSEEECGDVRYKFKNQF